MVIRTHELYIDTYGVSGTGCRGYERMPAAVDYSFAPEMNIEQRPRIWHEQARVRSHHAFFVFFCMPQTVLVD